MRLETSLKYGQIECHRVHPLLGRIYPPLPRDVSDRLVRHPRLRWPVIGVKHGGEGNLLLLPLPQPKHAPNGLKADARITEYTHEDDVVTVFQRRCPYHWTCRPPPRAPPAYGRSGYQSLKILSFPERTPHSTGWEVGHRTSGATCPFPYRSGGSSLPVTSAWQMAQQYTPPCRLLLSMGRLRAEPWLSRSIGSLQNPSISILRALSIAASARPFLVLDLCSSGFRTAW